MAEAREIVEACAEAIELVEFHSSEHYAIAGLLAALDKMQEPSEAMIHACMLGLAVSWIGMEGAPSVNRQRIRTLLRLAFAKLRREIAALGEEGRP